MLQTKPDTHALSKHRLILAGAGHAHLVMMRLWRDAGYRPPHGTVLISPDRYAWYSGMMPGLIAGRFRLGQCAIDLQPWCDALGIELMQTHVLALDGPTRQLHLAQGQVLCCETLSLNTGSMTAAPAVDDGSVSLVPAKPFPRFIEHWQQWRVTPPQRLMIAGGGAAAFEIAMALRQCLPGAALTLVAASGVLASHAPAVRRQALQCLDHSAVRCLVETRITEIKKGCVLTESGSLGSADALILATGASALPWYKSAGLSCNEEGFFCVNSKLQSLSDNQILVSGDAAAAAGSQRSGVFSVRHGAVLAHNLRAVLENTELESWSPQKTALALLATGDGGALMSYGDCGAGHALLRPLLGRWKDSLDLTFMRRHSI